MADPLTETGGRPGWTPPVGTNRRIQNRAIWAVALSAASFVPTMIGLAASVRGDEINVALLFAFAFWLSGVIVALGAAFPTLRYWENLPAPTRWLGVLPLLTISLLLSAALITAALS